MHYVPTGRPVLSISSLLLLVSTGTDDDAFY